MCGGNCFVLFCSILRSSLCCYSLLAPHGNPDIVLEGPFAARHTNVLISSLDCHGRFEQILIQADFGEIVYTSITYGRCATELCQLDDWKNSERMRNTLLSHSLSNSPFLALLNQSSTNSNYKVSVQPANNVSYPVKFEYKLDSSLHTTSFSISEFQTFLSLLGNNLS